MRLAYEVKVFSMEKGRASWRERVEILRAEEVREVLDSASSSPNPSF